jgi:hypothetical protein
MNNFLAEVVIASGGGLIHQFLFLVVVGIIIGILIWLVGIIPIIPAIFKQVLTWILYLIAAIVLINFLLGIVGHPFIEY